MYQEMSIRNDAADNTKRYDCKQNSVENDGNRVKELNSQTGRALEVR